jgi:DNA-binding transcriptional regulator YiaG
MKWIGKPKREKEKQISMETYRRILKMPNLTNKEIEEMRKYLNLLAQTICEHVWGKKFY